jgi:hypothetical protein
MEQEKQQVGRIIIKTTEETYFSKYFTITDKRRFETEIIGMMEERIFFELICQGENVVYYINKNFIVSFSFDYKLIVGEI